MDCKNILCIYQKDGECKLHKISIDARGMCTECIQPDFASDVLESARIRLLNDIEKREKTGGCSKL